MARQGFGENLIHPAPFVNVFTSLSGQGFGLFMWMGFDIPDVTNWEAVSMFFFSFTLTVSGLLASSFHLAYPKIAVHAFSEWRTS